MTKFTYDLHRVPLRNGYDDCGGYWGQGQKLWQANLSEDGREIDTIVFRVPSLKEAHTFVRNAWKGASYQR